MRFLNRLIAASVSTALVGLLFAIVPAAPASAANGVHTMSVQSTTVAEGGVATVTVTLNAKPFPGETISANLRSVNDSAVGGVDYSIYNQGIVFTCDGLQNCPQTQDVTVATTHDTSKEPDERFFMVLSNVQGATKGSDGSVTITNNDGGPTPTFVITEPAPANEGNANNNRIVQVSLSTGSDQQVTLNYATADDTATASPSKGTPDYTPTDGQLVWNDGDTSPRNIIVQVKGDTLPEPNEKFAVNFGSPNNAALPNNQAFVELINDDGDPPVITLAPTPPKPEGNATTSDMIITVNVSVNAPQVLTVDYTTGDGSAVLDDDYEETKGTLTISTGQNSKTVAVPIVGDQAAEPDETFTFTLTRATNAVLGEPSSQANTIVNDDFGQLTTAPGAGRVADIRIFGPAGAVLGGFPAYEPAFTNGAHVARGDFFTAGGAPGADGIDEIIVGPGPNSRPLVKIMNAADGAVRASFFAYDQNFRGGVFVASGNLDGDPANGDELIVAAGPGGGPHVRVLRVQNSSSVSELGGVMAFDPRFGGGIHVAAGDLVGDVRDEVVVAPAGGGGPHVRIVGISAQGQPSIVGEHMAYDPAFTGGVWLAVGGKKLVTGAGPGGGPHVLIFPGVSGTEEGGFMAYAPNFLGGVSVGAGNLDGDLAPEIVTGAGPGGGPHVRVFEMNGALPFGGGFGAYENFTGGVEVAIGNG